MIACGSAVETRTASSAVNVRCAGSTGYLGGANEQNAHTDIRIPSQCLLNALVPDRISGNVNEILCRVFVRDQETRNRSAFTNDGTMARGRTGNRKYFSV